MAEPFVDTDVFIRLLTGDDLKKQAAAFGLFEKVEQGKLRLAAPDTVIADAVFVLASPRLYRLPRAQVAAMLSRLVRLSGFRVSNKRTVLDALSLYGASSKLDFGDGMIVSAMRLAGAAHVYSFDADFDKVPGIARSEP